jgi:hypothetical protein
VNSYDPSQTPDTEEWLLLDEHERIGLVEAFHKTAKIKLPNAKAHAVFHTVVENQIAEEMESVVRAMTRLQKQGLSRHDCVHAIGWVLTQHFYELSASREPPDPAAFQAQYNAAIERLNADDWLAQRGS